MSISETAELFGKDPNYDLIRPNGIIGHFIVFIEAEEVSDSSCNHTVRKGFNLLVIFSVNYANSWLGLQFR